MATFTVRNVTPSVVRCWSLLLITVLVNECDVDIPSAPTQIEKKTKQAQTTSVRVQAPVSKPAPKPTCEDRIDALVPSGADKRLARYTKTLPYIAVNTRMVPVQYLSKPKPDPLNEVREISNSLGEKRSIRKTISAIKKQYKGNHAMMRRIFLKEGYFYEERTHVAPAVSKEISLPDLFSQETIFRLRGSIVETLHRHEGEYMDTDGERASLRLNDRVAVKEESLFPPRHLDLNLVRKETGAIQIKTSALFENAAAVMLQFPHGEMRPALIQLEKNQTVVSCIGGDPETLKATLDLASSFWRRHEQVVEAAKKLVAERPLFDEPKDEGEEVQEDGELRLAWKKAYRNREKKFWYREVEYDVYDHRGNPIPPEVCVDFIIDTWERAAGTWYTPRGSRPHRADGEIDFYAIEGFGRRYISSILDHAREDESPFLRYDVPRRDWIPLEKRGKFVRKLVKNAHHYQEGDLLVIHGLREEDMQEHYHTVLILTTDPKTGIPTIVADNQGRPRISTLVQAMRAAPKRSVKHRLRLNFDKMKQLTQAYREEKARE